VPPNPPYSAAYAVPPPPAVPGAAFSGNPYGTPVVPDTKEHKHPLGAIVLIGIGLVLLLHTLGVFEDEWISRGWPVLIIGVGAWLLYRRTRDLPRGGSQ
jgi:protein-S-isoprenylcysteine O-methyltransferase Ste14